jgi:hypothetical protein
MIDNLCVLGLKVHAESLTGYRFNNAEPGWSEMQSRQTAFTNSVMRYGKYVRRRRTVIPANAGIRLFNVNMDSRLRGKDTTVIHRYRQERVA